jgi:hypothetical protein
MFYFSCILLFSTLITPTPPPYNLLLSGVRATCFSLCSDKDSAIIFRTGCLPGVNPP